jgi:hypothetical protein
MPKRLTVDILKQLNQVVIAWELIDPNLKIGSLTLAEYRAMLDHGKAIRNEIGQAEARLTDLRNQRDEVYSQAWRYSVRLRQLIQGTYGDDSSQYEMIGGTRRSERKPRSRPEPSPVSDAAE